MSYSKTLSAMIKKSGLSLREIADKCKEYNVKIDPSYISKLQSGNQAPASDDVNIALAKVCGYDPGDFLYEAYMEKAPKLIKDFIKQILDFCKGTIGYLVDAQFPPELAQVVKKEMEKYSDLEMIKYVVSEEFSPIAPQNESTFLVPNELPDGKDISLMVGPSLGLTMQDDSMEPVIPKDAKVQLDSKASKISNGNIVVTVLQDKTYVVRRYVTLNDKQTALVAYNNKYAPIVVDNDELKVAGKVKSYTKEL